MLKKTKKNKKNVCARKTQSSETIFRSSILEKRGTDQESTIGYPSMRSRRGRIFFQTFHIIMTSRITILRSFENGTAFPEIRA